MYGDLEHGHGKLTHIITLQLKNIVGPTRKELICSSIVLMPVIGLGSGWGRGGVKAHNILSGGRSLGLLFPLYRYNRPSHVLSIICGGFEKIMDKRSGLKMYLLAHQIQKILMQGLLTPHNKHFTRMTQVTCMYCIFIHQGFPT